MQDEAKSIHFGADGDGYYFSFVSMKNGDYHSIKLNNQQVYLLLKQTIDVIYDECVPEVK